MTRTAAVILFFIIVSAQMARAQTVDTIVNTRACKLHFNIIRGKGTAILFEAGGALSADQWKNIGKAVNKATGATIITYDRQGFGQSGMDTANYNIQNEIYALEYALRELGYAGKPVITVCHSLGNFYSLLYASRHPQAIRGMVLIDPRVPSIADAWHAREIFNATDQPKLKQESLPLYFILRDMEANSSDLSHLHIPSNIPVLNLMAEHGPWPTAAENEAFKAAQLTFIKRFANHQLVFVKGSEHNIAYNKPALVIKHITVFYKKHY